jgi:hypothetical protein
MNDYDVYKEGYRKGLFLGVNDVLKMNKRGYNLNGSYYQTNNFSKAYRDGYKEGYIKGYDSFTPLYNELVI